ncbi:MAG: helix-turn-helix domain-containing protein [Pseudonocardiaceae bacterium]
MPTGQLIRLYRIDRRKSTVSLATNAGITVRYLEMIEAGSKTPSLPVLRGIAQVLGVRTAALISDAPSESHEGPVNPRLAEIERALFTYRSVSLIERATPAELSDIFDRIKTAEETWYTAPESYAVLDLLPGLIVDTEHAARESGGSPESCQAAYQLYRLVRGVLKQSGRIDLCALIADRTMRYAEQTEDPLIMAAASWTLGQTLLSDDMPHGALDVAMISTEKLEPLLPEGTPEHFSVYGGLIQCAAIAATRTGDPWRARELLRDRAKPAAERVGEGKNYHNIFFGPTNVGIHAVAVEMETAECAEALRIANDVDISKSASRERQACHLLNVARCYDLKGNDTAVLVHLQMVEKVRPQAFRYRREPRDMVSTLIRRAKPSYASEVRAFAGRIGLLD